MFERDTKKDDVAEFDKLVWANNILSELYYPKAIDSRLINGGFKGQIKHSADVVDIDLLIQENAKANTSILQGQTDKGWHHPLQHGLGIKQKVWNVSLLRLSTMEWVCFVLRLNMMKILLATTFLWRKVNRGWELEDIMAAVYCTGYGTNMHYVEEDLKYEYYSDGWSAPKGWKLP
jgi:hypothetical protein